MVLDKMERVVYEKDNFWMVLGSSLNIDFIYGHGVIKV